MTCVIDDDTRHPGKFEACGPVGEALYELSLDGCDDEFGSVDEGGWYGLILDTGLACASYAILSEDSQGFVEYGAYDTEEKAMHDWARIQTGTPAWYEEDAD
jgi:hypothetical protein